MAKLHLYFSKDCALSPDANLKVWAQTVLDMRQRRAAQFGTDLCADPAWDIILVLAMDTQSALSEVELFEHLTISENVARRWLSILIERGIVQSVGAELFQLSHDGAKRLQAVLPGPLTVSD